MPSRFVIPPPPDLLPVAFRAAPFRAPAFRPAAFFAVAPRRDDFLAAEPRRDDFFAAGFRRTDFLALVFRRDVTFRADFREADLRRVDFFAALRFLPALRADFFRPPFLAAIGISPRFKDHFPATARSPRIAASFSLKRDASDASESAVAASALSSRLAGAYSR